MNVLLVIVNAVSVFGGRVATPVQEWRDFLAPEA